MNLSTIQPFYSGHHHNKTMVGNMMNTFPFNSSTTDMNFELGNNSSNRNNSKSNSGDVTTDKSHSEGPSAKKARMDQEYILKFPETKQDEDEVVSIDDDDDNNDEEYNNNDEVDDNENYDSIDIINVDNVDTDDVDNEEEVNIECDSIKNLNSCPVSTSDKTITTNNINNSHNNNDDNKCDRFNKSMTISSSTSSLSASSSSPNVSVNQQLFIKLENEHPSINPATYHEHRSHMHSTPSNMLHDSKPAILSNAYATTINQNINNNAGLSPPLFLNQRNTNESNMQTNNTTITQPNYVPPVSDSTYRIETETPPASPHSPHSPSHLPSSSSSPPPPPPLLQCPNTSFTSSSSSSSSHHSPLNLSGCCLEPLPSSAISSENHRTDLPSSSSSSTLPSPINHLAHPCNASASINSNQSKHSNSNSKSNCDALNSNTENLDLRSSPNSHSCELGHKNISSSNSNNQNATKNNNPRKTNFSIDVILSSNFGIDDSGITNSSHHENNKAENQTIINSCVHHDDSVPGQSTKYGFNKSTNSAFTSVIDLSLKTRPQISFLTSSSSSSSSSSSFSPTESSSPLTSATAATPPSPPLSSPSSSSTSSLQRSYCRSPQDDDEENKFLSPNNYNNNSSENTPDFMKSFPVFNPNIDMSPHNINNTNNIPEKQFPVLGQHPQFLYPFTAVAPGQTLIKNPTLFIERHFPMFYNTFGHNTHPGKFPVIYSPIPNIPTNNTPTEIPNPNNLQNIKPHVKPDFKISNNPQHIMYNHHHHQQQPQGNPHQIPKRKPQNSITKTNILPKPPQIPTLISQEISPNQKLYSKYSMDIKEKLNSILDSMSPIPKDPLSTHHQQQHKHSTSSNSKRDSKISDRARNNSPSTSLLSQPCKPEGIKSNFHQNERGNNTNDVTTTSERKRTSTKERTHQQPNRKDKQTEGNTTKTKGENPLLPAWVFCTRYSDRPSSGPRSRKPKRKAEQEEKRPRTAFTNDQLLRLRREFDDCRYLTETRRQSLADELGLSESQIKIWFQNKRAKIKKSVGVKNPLALQLMKQGLYNHCTVKSDDEMDPQEIN